MKKSIRFFSNTVMVLVFCLSFLTTQASAATSYILKGKISVEQEKQKNYEINYDLSALLNNKDYGKHLMRDDFADKTPLTTSGYRVIVNGKPITGIDQGSDLPVYETVPINSASSIKAVIPLVSSIEDKWTEAVSGNSNAYIYHTPIKYFDPDAQYAYAYNPRLNIPLKLKIGSPGPVGAQGTLKKDIYGKVFLLSDRKLTSQQLTQLDVRVYQLWGPQITLRKLEGGPTTQSTASSSSSNVPVFGIIILIAVGAVLGIRKSRVFIGGGFNSLIDNSKKYSEFQYLLMITALTGFIIDIALVRTVFEPLTIFVLGLVLILRALFRQSEKFMYMIVLVLFAVSVFFHILKLDFISQKIGMWIFILLVINFIESVYMFSENSAQET